MDCFELRRPERPILNTKAIGHRTSSSVHRDCRADHHAKHLHERLSTRHDAGQRPMTRIAGSKGFDRVRGRGPCARPGLVNRAGPPPKHPPSAASMGARGALKISSCATTLRGKATPDPHLTCGVGGGRPHGSLPPLESGPCVAPWEAATPTAIPSRCRPHVSHASSRRDEWVPACAVRGV